MKCLPSFMFFRGKLEIICSVVWRQSFPHLPPQCRRRRQLFKCFFSKSKLFF